MMVQRCIFLKIQSVQLTPLSTHWAPKKKNSSIFFGHPVFTEIFPLKQSHVLNFYSAYRGH